MRSLYCTEVVFICRFEWQNKEIFVHIKHAVHNETSGNGLFLGQYFRTLRFFDDVASSLTRVSALKLNKNKIHDYSPGA